MKPTTKIIFLDNFLFGILAGAAIGVGGLLNLLCLSINQKLLGSFAFSIGLLTVCVFGLHLYTGKIGYVQENKKKRNYISLLLIIIGNAIGAIGFGYLLRLSPLKDLNVIYTVAQNKSIFASDNWLEDVMKVFGLSFLCGNMVFLAVDIFKKNKNWLIKIIPLILCVAFFVYFGMEHCIANMFYFAFANAYSKDIYASLLPLLIAILGNSIGAIVLYNIINKSTLKTIL